MSCYHHPDREAVAQCSVCGKTLCRECADLYSPGPPICAACARLGASELKSEVIKMGAIGVAIFIGWIIFNACIAENQFNFVGYIFGGILIGCIPFGWRALTSITPRIFLILPVVGWLIYFFVKLFISFFIGWIACPVKIYKTVRTLKAVQEHEIYR